MEQRIECIGDRFVAAVDGSSAIDLATGETVTLIVSPAGARDDELRWTARCDAAYGRWSSSAEVLVDYGRCGEARRFEAWRMPGRGQRSRARVAIDHVERRVEAALAELFEHAEPVSRAICVVGPHGAGKSAVLRRLARYARLQGIVPFAVQLLESPLAAVLDGRSALLLDDERATGWRALAELALRSARPHVLVHASRDDPPGTASVVLTRLSAAALIAAVGGVGAQPRVQRAATRAGGNPGTFVRLLEGVHRHRRRHIVPVASKVAEQAPVYSASTPSADPPWPAPAEIAALRCRLRDGIRGLDQGRRARGERDVRHAVGALMRRGEWADAAEGSLALASSLLKRGRPREAKAVIEAARDACRKAAGDRLLIRAATLSGAALTDLGRLDDAEAVLSAAQTVATHAEDATAAADVALTLARGRFWRGHYSGARDALAAIITRDLDEALRVRVELMSSRLAVASDDLAGALRLCARAVERARVVGQAQLIADAMCASAFAHLTAGDLAAVRQDVDVCVEASRVARDPLRGVRAQLLLCEQLRRSGAREEAATLFARLRRLPVSVLPRILRCRRDLVGEMLAVETADATTLARHIASTGLHALALFAPKDARPARLHGAPSTPIEDAIEVLRVCQEAADESATLTLVCEQVQRRTGAVAAGFFGIEAGGLAGLASRGPRLETATAQRAIDAAVLLPPHQLDERVEAAAPVHYAGQTIGALGLRWVIGSAPDADRVGAVLSMAVAAAGPIVAAALAGRRQSDAAACGDLLGASDSIVEVRRAVARAAVAPFAVLIEGESGSGKELVARAIHQGGLRRSRPFVTLNCAALPDDLVESELFGHARGAFTGAVGERVGVFEEAHTGTLFLDEVGELSARAQAKLLRVIQEGELRRIGENVSRRIDIRIVSATNRDLRAESAAGRFRLDLLYRLDVVRIDVPPLRDRREDIPMLVAHIWREAAARYGSHATLGPAVVAALVRYDWPGNVRELQNVLASLVVRVGRRGVVPVSALPPAFAEFRTSESHRLDTARRSFDERFVRAALVRCGGRRARAASELGLTRQGLAKLMARLGIQDDALS